MKNVRLVQVGIGTVGGRVLELVAEHQSFWREMFDVNVTVAAISTSSGMLLPAQEHFNTGDLVTIVSGRRAGTRPEQTAAQINARWTTPEGASSAFAEAILLDAAAGSESSALAERVLDAGGSIVYSNKAPLAQDLASASGSGLWNGVHRGTVRYETTCGAGLPVISTIASLIASGDGVLGVTGCLSGTLGAIFSDIADGNSFSNAIVAAKDAGYTEPDPRDDLSGLDVARKALILARTIGRRDDLSDIAIESLVPETLADCSVTTFLERIADHNQIIASRHQSAANAGAALKYVATVPAEGPITVGIAEVPRSTVLGALQGPENIVSIRTARYDRYPLTVSGPGAGADVTAAGMIVDMLELAKAGR